MSSPVAWVALALCLATTVLGFENPTHIRYVDHDASTGNFLFRTGDPTNATTLDYDKLVHYFKLRAQAKGLKLPEKFYLVDLSFWSVEIKKIEKEAKFFREHPKLGKLHLWPIVGVTQVQTDAACELYHVKGCPPLRAQPAVFPKSARTELAKTFPHWDVDELGTRLRIARRMLTTKSSDGIPLVIFGHCSCGCDRTGEFFASYMMQYQNYNFTTAMHYDDNVPHRNITYYSQLGAQWYCLELYQRDPTKYSQLTDCDNCKPFQCYEPWLNQAEVQAEQVRDAKFLEAAEAQTAAEEETEAEAEAEVAQ